MSIYILSRQTVYILGKHQNRDINVMKIDYGRVEQLTNMTHSCLTFNNNNNNNSLQNGSYVSEFYLHHLM